MEIERKWLLKGFPSDIYKIRRKYFINQSYLSTQGEVRIRSMEELNINESSFEYFLSFKTTGNLVREEVEIQIDLDTYKRLFDMIDYSPIQKEYRQYYVAGFIVEISKVDNEWYYAEVEFESEKDAMEFTFPFQDLVIQEVTNDPKFKMKNYWNRKHNINMHDSTKSDASTIY